MILSILGVVLGTALVVTLMYWASLALEREAQRLKAQVRSKTCKPPAV